MPRRELKHPSQVENWLIELSQQLTQPARMILIGSGALLWHAFQRGIPEPLPENSMNVDPIPKRKRNEPRDRAHAAWAERLGLIS